MNEVNEIKWLDAPEDKDYHDPVQSQGHLSGFGFVALGH